MRLKFHSLRSLSMRSLEVVLVSCCTVIRMLPQRSLPPATTSASSVVKRCGSPARSCRATTYSTRAVSAPGSSANRRVPPAEWTSSAFSSAHSLRPSRRRPLQEYRCLKVGHSFKDLYSTSSRKIYSEVLPTPARSVCVLQFVVRTLVSSSPQLLPPLRLHSIHQSRPRVINQPCSPT